MNACINPNTASTDDIESTIATLSEEVADLLSRITGVEATRSEGSGTARLVSPLTFPDNIGDGTIVGALFRYRDGVRLDLRIDHNRVFAGQDGRPTDRRCFLNDFVASITLEPGTDALPSEFVRNVVSGALAAREAVSRHNRKAQAPWNEVRVTAKEESAVTAP